MARAQYSRAELPRVDVDRVGLAAERARSDAGGGGEDERRMQRLKRSVVAPELGLLAQELAQERLGVGLAQSAALPVS